MEPVCPWLLDVVLLRCGKIPMSVEDCFPRRVVKALASDILDGPTVEECTDARYYNSTGRVYC